MRPTSYNTLIGSHQFVLLFFFSTSFIPFCSSAPSPSTSNPLNIDWDPAPAPEDGPPASAGALRDPAYLPAQIGGIVGAYALSLVAVAAVLLVLAKKRREHLEAADNPELEYEVEFVEPSFDNLQNPPFTPGGRPKVPYPLQTPKSPYKNFSYPSPEKDGPNPYIFPSPHSQTTLGLNPLVDQNIVAADRIMAQSQLEEMYKYVMEQEAAKEAGIMLDGPPGPMPKKPPTQFTEKPQGTLAKKGRNKPANLDLNKPELEKKESRASSLLSALRSPRSRKQMKGVSISSPIMTPMSGTFPPQEGEELGAIPPRQYAPPPPPPVPMDHFRRNAGQAAPLTPPDLSPESTQSIDERLGNRFDTHSHTRNPSQAPTEPDPISAASENSTTPLVGLPSSPRANRFPSLPSSPRGATFSRPNAPSAVRTGGALPLRAYEPSLASPSTQHTKQTVFERAGPLSPSGQRTPFTGAAVPYSPYQPFTPVVPITPSLVTREDRKRMKKMVPKTPTMELVQSSDDIW